jgi:hypothetical protein
MATSHRRLMLFACAAFVALGVPHAEPMAHIEVATAQCPAYVAPEKFEFPAWDRVGPRDPCVLGEIKALLDFLETERDAEQIEIIKGRLADLYMQAGDEAAAGLVIQSMAEPSDDAARQSSTTNGYTAIDAVAYIAGRASGHRLVILNEDHAAPRHRDFARQLLKVLRKRGFTHFAAEAFERDPEAFRRSHEGGPPTFASGYYVRDPSFGRLIREAKALGFALVTYEPFEPVNGPVPDVAFEAHVHRERSAAKNLQARVFAGNPRAKLFVYVGFSHLIEEEVQRTLGPGKAKWMAAELKSLTGLDPLTVDQVSLTPGLDARWDDPDYRVVAPLLSGAAPKVVLKNGARAGLGFYGDKVDISVAHPRLKDAQGRSGWVLSGTGHSHVIAQAPARGLMRLRIEGEAGDAVAFDQMLVPQAGPVVLLVPGQGRVKAEFVPW